MAQFTNFTQDHLDYHGSMAAYWQAKRALFDWPGLQAAVVNLDDPMGAGLCAHARSRGLAVWSYGVDTPARLQAQQVRHEAMGIAFTLVEHTDSGLAELSRIDLQAPVIGRFNVSNLLAVVGALRALGVPLADAAAACRALHAVPGRMDLVAVPPALAATLPLAVVDYAHTPDALEKALQALRPVAEARGGRLWCVFGCGGNRDPIKRPLMGGIADQLADHVVLTSDNPRHEDPHAILAQVRAGVHGRARLAVVADRREAIAEALADAEPHDVVLIAGKGHEDYQEIAGVRTPFSDVEEARAALAQRANQAATGGAA